MSNKLTEILFLRFNQSNQIREPKICCKILIISILILFILSFQSKMASSKNQFAKSTTYNTIKSNENSKTNNISQKVRSLNRQLSEVNLIPKSNNFQNSNLSFEELKNNQSDNDYYNRTFNLAPEDFFFLWNPYFFLEATISMINKNKSIAETNDQLVKFLRMGSRDHLDLSKLISSSNWTPKDLKRSMIISYKDFDHTQMGITLLERTKFFKKLWQAFNLDFHLNSLYLRNLGMEIIEIPNNFSIIEFKEMLLSQASIIEDIFEDFEVSNDDFDIEQPSNNKPINFETFENNINESISYKDLNYQTFSYDSKSDYIRNLKTQMIPNDAGFHNQWAFIDSGNSKWGIEIQSAWQYWTGDKLEKKFIIALIDSGVDYKHPDLMNSLWKNEKEDCTNGIDDDGNGYIDDCYGWDFVNNDNNTMDDNGHGTASAGILAAQTNNNLGVAGMCWGCELMILKALNHNIKGSVSGFVKAVDYALEKGVKLSSNSYGGRGSDFDALKEAVKRAQKQGMIFVAAAGNYQGNNDNDKNPVYPASYSMDNVISVAAITRNGRLADFSSYGKNSVDIAAPGERIFSTFTGSSYRYVDGTSFAVPFVTGAVALLWSSNPMLHYDEVIATIVENQKPSPYLKGLTRTAGVLDVSRVFENTKSITITSYEENKSLKSCKEYNPCDINANCKDEMLGPKCTCLSGFFGDGYNCQDIDECSFNPCGSVSTCINHFGSFECECNKGFKKVGDSCQDIDECKNINLCSNESKCYNYAGTYDCVCPNGYFWSISTDGTSNCLKYSNENCNSGEGCGINSICKSRKNFLFNSYICECLPGHYKDSETGICILNDIMNFQKDDYIKSHEFNQATSINYKSQIVESDVRNIGFCIFGICF